MKDVLLLSGGMDSICLAYWKRPEHAITIDYGQLAAVAEIEASAEICRELGIQHHILTVNTAYLGSGDMAGKVKNKNAPESDWWPYRNQFIVTVSAMKAISLDVSQIIIGCVKTDNQHVDGTQVFVNQLNTLLSMQEGNIQLTAPAIELTTDELIEKSKIPIPLLFWSHSCHKAIIACGKCRGCSKYFEIWQMVLPNTLES